MNIKFRSIEFFGVSGSGKSYLRGFIKKKLEEEGFQIFDTREIIVNFINICMSFILDVQEALYVAIENAHRLLYTLETFFNSLLCLISIVPVSFFVTAVLPNILIIIMAGILLGVGYIMTWFFITAPAGLVVIKFALFTMFVSSIVGIILKIIHHKSIDFAEGAAGACMIAERESM